MAASADRRSCATCRPSKASACSGLILFSPLLDFRDFPAPACCNMSHSLPTMAAVAREAKGPVTRNDLADVERYARGDFLLDLLKGQADAEATNRLADKVASLTGIDQAVSRRLAGRFEVGEFRREFDRKNGKVTGRYDASVSGFDPYPDSSYSSFRRSFRRSADGAADQRRGRSHHAQAELAAGWLVPICSTTASGRSWDFGRGESGRVGFPVAAVSRARSEDEAAGRPRPVRSRHAIFRLARSSSTSCRPLPAPTASSSRSIPAGTCSIRAMRRGRRFALKRRR